MLPITPSFLPARSNHVSCERMNGTLRCCRAAGRAPDSTPRATSPHKTRLIAGVPSRERVRTSPVYIALAIPTCEALQLRVDISWLVLHVWLPKRGQQCGCSHPVGRLEDIR